MPCVGDMNDPFFDHDRHRVYVTGGAGAVSVVAKQDNATHTGGDGGSSSGGCADQEERCLVSTVTTGVGARTGFWHPEQDTPCVAVPAAGTRPSHLLAFEPV